MFPAHVKPSGSFSKLNIPVMVRYCQYIWVDKHREPLIVLEYLVIDHILLGYEGKTYQSKEDFIV